MNRIYPRKEFLCSENVNLKEYFSGYYALLTTPIKPPTGIKIPPKTLEELEATTSPSLLDKKKPGDDDCKEIMELNTLKVFKSRKERFPNLKWEDTKKCSSKDNTASSSVDVTPIEYIDEFIVHVRIYQPFEFKYQTIQPNGIHNLKFSQEILVAGGNTLAQLRDKISCFNDTGMFRVVEDPFKKPLLKPDAKEEYPSGFFFIDDVFYNDLRHPKSIAYSDVIMDWAKKNKVEPLNTDSMETTKIEHLAPRFGYPYLYMHQGKCEHIIVFPDARLLTNRDLNPTSYPTYEATHRFRSKICVLCSDALSQWMITDCDRLPYTYAFLCTECMRSYLYIDGKKVTDFKVFQYYGQHNVPL